ncbi:MAG: agmatinase family protein [Deltaproteobacteria bacterium]|nr:agmatinase family protein [Deltaproteobacteria bacterium]
MDKKLKDFWAETIKDASFAAGTYIPRINGDTPSFMLAPIAFKPEELENADVAVIGIPWQGAVGVASGVWASFGPKGVYPEEADCRTGTYDAPDYIRKYSEQYNIQHTGGYYPEVGPDFFLSDHIQLMDYGNVEIKEWDIDETANRAIEKVGDIVRAGAVPLVFGGDHSIPYPVARAISDNTQGDMGLIWFDRHYDNLYGGELPYPYGEFGRLNCGNALYKILDTCRVDPSNVVMIGIGGGDVNTPMMHKIMVEAGIKVFTVTDVERLGIEDVTQQAIEISGKGTDRTYVTLDADTMDPFSFPAMRWAEPFGMSAKDVRKSLAMISQNTNLAGFDICCISPAYDTHGLGGLVAARMYIEVLKGMALRKKNKGSVV